MNADSAWIALAVAALILVAWELLFPVRARKPDRWLGNAALGAISLAIAMGSRIAGPLAGAVWADAHDFGLLRLVILPDWFLLLASIALMDLAVWFQHMLFHKLPWLWELHTLHHRDVTLDLTTGFRFHPLEAMVSLLYKGAFAALLGVPIWAVAAFEAWLIAGNLFEHANIRLSARVEGVLRRFIVTPPMHRVHHSRHSDDSNHNFGFAISLWDRLFGTYRHTESGSEIGFPGLK
jgi:sterol desaturase/sphingolipid hydroxylase (fatty acid hydroxylase superfamily)